MPFTVSVLNKDFRNGLGERGNNGDFYWCTHPFTLIDSK